MMTVKYITVLLFSITTIISRAQISLKKISEQFIYINPPFAQCHASTIVEIDSNRFMAAAFGGTREGDEDVCIWLSTNENGKWNSPVKIAVGVINDSLRHPTWNPVLFKSENGKLFLFYKEGPSPATWWGMVRTSDNNGKTWKAATRLPEGILGPIKNKPVQLKDGTILSPSSTENDGWKVHIEKSVNEGKTWKSIPVDNSTGYSIIQPTILIHPDKELQILCRSNSNFILQSYSKDNGNTWGAVTKTAIPNPNSGIDAVTLRNGYYLLVYNPTVIGKNDRARLNVAVSKDGAEWMDAMVLENEEEGEFGYPAVIQAGDGKIHITYTYNRENVKHVILNVSD